MDGKPLPKDVGVWRQILLALLDHAGATRAELAGHAGLTHDAVLVELGLSLIQRDTGATCVRIDHAGRCWPHYDRDSVMRARTLWDFLETWQPARTGLRWAITPEGKAALAGKTRGGAS